MRIPYDGIVLAAFLQELQPYLGSLVQGVRQPDGSTICLNLYRSLSGEGKSGGKEAMLLLSCDPNFARAHFATKRPPNAPQPPVFCATLRARIDGGRLIQAVQIARDRLLCLTFASERGEHRLYAELMGKHSNLILVDESGKVVSAAKWVGPEKSVRPILSGRSYELPPVLEPAFLKLPPIATPAEWVAFGSKHPSAVSPFFRRWLASDVAAPEHWGAFLAQGQGVYPLPIDPLGIESLVRADLSAALELYNSTAFLEQQTESRRAALRTGLERVLLAREAAITDLGQAIRSAGEAPRRQLYGELILAYGAGLPANAKELDAYDYEGNPIKVKLDPDLDFRANANAYFDKAKRAKARLGMVTDQLSRLEADRSLVEHVLLQVAAAQRLSELEEIAEQARKRKWLLVQHVAASKEDRPYQGHRIKELLGPGGVRVLYGENAESNDYLTLRVAKPNDMWLHVRGSVSAHVVIVSDNHPEKIQKEHLMFAAKVAVLNSPSKHGGYVPVDYTLRRYVRRPHGAPKGTALYTHEKTVHVES